jgi:hypothetical protein
LAPLVLLQKGAMLLRMKESRRDSRC